MARPRSLSLVAGFLLVGLLAGLLAVPVAAGPAEPRVGSAAQSTGGPPGALAPPIAATNATDVDPDAVVMAVRVAPNGTATWRVAYRLRLNDDNETAAFESLQADVAANETAYTVRFAERMNRTVGLAENATGRSMSIGPVDVETRREAIPQEYGILTYEFRWYGFAATAGDRLLVGDAVSGLFLDRQTTLRVEWPAAYTPRSVDPAPDERQVDTAIWRGPTEFADDQPRLALARATPTATSAPASGSGTEPQGGTTGRPSWPVGGLLVLVLLTVVAVYAYHRRSSGGDGPAPAGPTAGAGTSGESGEDTPTELMSNEERVLQLLEDNGGRMKQQAVADRLEWTDAKTSQVIGDLRDAGDVETFRLGRENVVTLPDAGGPIE